jgi:hypothetical protein
MLRRGGHRGDRFRRLLDVDRTLLRDDHDFFQPGGWGRGRLVLRGAVMKHWQAKDRGGRKQTRSELGIFPG